MKDTRIPSQPPHGSSSPLRADLIAANIFQRCAGNEITDGFKSCLTLAGMATCAFDAAAAFIAEARRRDSYTGELFCPTDGLPTDE